MRNLTIFHDPNCGLCRTFKDWLIFQESYFPLFFIPYNSATAQERMPLITELDAKDNLVVLADDGRWWQGPSAWLTCLWALKKFREWSLRLATPALLPHVEKMCYLLSQNRLRISQLLHLRSENLEQIVDGFSPQDSKGVQGEPKQGSLSQSLLKAKTWKD